MSPLYNFELDIVTAVSFLCVLSGVVFPSCHGCSADECRIILFEEPIANRAIKGHVIRRSEVLSEGSCRTMCYMEPNCVSINVKPIDAGKYNCELNNATVDESKLTFFKEVDAYYLAIENPCSSSPCVNNGTCQVGFTSKGFRCVCVPGYAGANCSVLSRSCSDLKRLDPKAKSGICLIDPDGEGGLLPFLVTCDMSDNDRVGVTVISHDS
ncbi:contactin-associated protein 1-like, partial [Stylophora pistillata]|uniref:contactin-associated protein 1-like n=1 Tax=Stylophora pistillata TaxID=50429 RepID=UPI000C04DC1B